MISKKFLTTFFILLLSIHLTGCAGLNERECREADWEMIGFQDGIIGKYANWINSYRSACAEYHIVPNAAAYETGHNRGIKQYCTEDNGFKLGRQGFWYDGVCPTELEPAFLKGYYYGRELSGWDHGEE